MVCAKCQKKLSRNITPDTHKWTRNAKAKNEKKKDMSKILENRLNHKKKKTKFKKSGKSSKPPKGTCRICKGVCHQKEYYYCHPCAYQKGICSMCGKKLLDTSKYCQSNV